MTIALQCMTGLAAGFLCAQCWSADLPPGADEVRAMNAVREYSEAFQRMDVDGMLRWEHPVLKLRAGGEGPYRELVTQLLEHFRAVGMGRARERLGTPSYMYSDRSSRMIGVPALRKGDGITTTPLVYVAVSYDGGRAWQVLGLSCTDEKWLKALVPEYNGFPDILGMGNPEVLGGLSDETFDEGAFLRGPRAAAKALKE